MQAIKCLTCGFTGFPDKGCCKRCGHTLGSPNKSQSLRGPETEGLTSRWLKNPLVLVVLLVVVIAMAGAVVVPAKLETYFDKRFAYIEAINESPQFREALTVRVNQKEICVVHNCLEAPSMGKDAGKATRAADVLEGLGLLTMSTEATFTQKETDFYYAAPRRDGYQPFSGPSGGLVTRGFVKVKSERLIIELTDEGHKEMVNWKEILEPYSPGDLPGDTSPKLSWWHVPIGEREVTRIEFVGRSDANTVSITFRWRWRPNTLGENFDCSNAAVQSLPQKARNAAVSLGWNSQTEHQGFATLRRSGTFWTDWEVTKVSYPLEVLQQQRH